MLSNKNKNHMTSVLVILAMLFSFANISPAAAAGANVLLLADTAGTGTPALVTALTTAGYSVTVFTPEYNWNGSPALADFQCVIHLDGTTYSTPLSVSAQLALVTYVESGHCFVGTQWDGYERATGIQTSMNDLILQGWPGSQQFGPTTLTTVTGQAGHPVLAGITSPVLVNGGYISPGIQYSYSVDPSTVLMVSSTGEPAVLVREFGSGCVVNLAFALNYTGSEGLNDPTIQRLFINSLDWGTSSSCGGNQPPTADAGGPYIGDEGSAIAMSGATASDPDIADTLTYTWTSYSSLCSFSNANELNPNLTCSDNGSFTVVLEVSDGSETVSSDANVTVNNVDPSVTVNNGTVTVDEGQTASNTGSYSDVPADTVSLSVDMGSLIDNGDGTWSWSFASTDGPNQSSLVTITAQDEDGGLSNVSFNLVVNNVAPTLGAISVDQALVPAGTAINTSASFTDPGTLDTHTAVWDWGDGSTSVGTISESGGNGTASDSHSYSTPGVYTLRLTVTDKDGDASNESVYEYVVVYDPDGGFVTGGGWINSPAGAYTADPSLTGKASFGFVAKYKKGQSTPDGNTEFQFKAGNLNFNSTSYQWLVVAGSKAQFKGEGTINGNGHYGFMLTARDGNPDQFRIKIWDMDNGDSIMYDNLMGGADDADPTTSLGGGSIVIHN